MNDVVSIRGPYFDKRGAKLGCSGKYDRPWCLTVKHGRTGSLISRLQFRTEEEARAFVGEHQPIRRSDD